MASEGCNQPGATNGASTTPSSANRAEQRKPPALDTDVRHSSANAVTAAAAAGAISSSAAQRSLFGDDNGPDRDEDAPPSTPAQTLTSPVTSPPYWAPSPQQERRRHARPGAMTNQSAESIVAITMWDNETEEDEAAVGRQEQGGETGDGGRRRNSANANVEGRDKNRACWARSVDVVDYCIVNGSTTNIGAFVVYKIQVETLTGSRMNIIKRYSEFDDLREKLIFSFPNFQAAVPALPPKSVIMRFSKSFLEKRKAGLHYFLNCVLLNPEFSGSPIMREFLFL